MTTNATTTLDEMDDLLLTMLRDDARQTIAQLAKKLGVSRSQIYTRLARFEEDKNTPTIPPRS